MRVPKPEMKKARIEIIPMIDAIFFLLVFFMFSSLSMIRMKGANVALPAAPSTANAQNAGAASGGETPKLVVSVTNSGAYYLNKTALTRQTLPQSVQEQLSARPNSVVVLNMAPNQTTQSLVDLLDSLHKVKTPAGTPPTVLIATQPVDDQGQPIDAKAR